MGIFSINEKTSVMDGKTKRSGSSEKCSADDIGSLSDGYHTFDELYEFRKAYNACLFNEWYKQGLYSVHKSLKHHDGGLCFGGGWFIVSCVTPFGQISNHYEEKDWELFKCEISTKALVEYDGHTGSDVLFRLKATAMSDS